ncbi:ABC transporter ATP-binding protein [Cellulomonas sp. ES6]|uniref:ABC transporter ATP-binding protein n=1 Tax=Cellulomonas sp. ES6 TaxID=3039384 RepID=UPI0019930972|nr:ABC transporter ATP-binding protein [Cellulomonas sp. ES6]MBD3778210.1 ABC transporter ATP-binding protein [Micrococcales bacterium]WHP15940.1 ABC transporter ATP-binding protein [Cellulomonas sp. ES6]
MTALDVEVQDLTVRYGRTVALDGVTLSVPAGAVTGLLGRNGSGKTTLASVVAAFRRPTAGRVLVGGREPWEDEDVVPRILLVRESGDVLDSETLRTNLRYTADSRPAFSREVAERLMDRFALDPGAKPQKLSRGQKSAFGIVLAVAARADLTILDEVHLGLDAPARYAFYDALLEDYVEHPRTVLLSSHLIAEVERLLEHVVVIDHGRVLLAQEADALTARGVSVTGPVREVERFVVGRTVLGRQQLGGTAQATVLASPSDAERADARAAGLELGPVPLQDLFVHLTAEGAGEAVQELGRVR